MKPYYLAGQFLLKTVLGHKRPLISEQKIWQLKDRKVSVIYCFPKVKQPVRGTILLVHGMNCLGAEDPRLLAVAQNFVRLGYICVLPTIQSITEHLILPTQADEIRAVMKKLIADQQLCPNGSFGVFSASFSGALSILAASDAEIQQHVKAILTIGIYHDGAQTMADILSSDCNDYFARLIGVKNIFRLSGQVDLVLDQALDAAIYDNFTYVSKSDHVKDYLATLSKHDQQRVQTVLKAIQQNKYQLPDEVINHFDAQAFRHGFDFLHTLDQVPFHVFVLHSLYDKIMAVRHVYAYRDYLKSKQLSKQHPVLITGMLDHAETQLSLKEWVLSLRPLLKFFAGFFKRVS